MRWPRVLGPGRFRFVRTMRGRIFSAVVPCGLRGCGGGRSAGKLPPAPVTHRFAGANGGLPPFFGGERLANSSGGLGRRCRATGWCVLGAPQRGRPVRSRLAGPTRASSTTACNSAPHAARSSRSAGAIIEAVSGAGAGVPAERPPRRPRRSHCTASRHCGPRKPALSGSDRGRARAATSRPPKTEGDEVGIPAPGHGTPPRFDMLPSRPRAAANDPRHKIGDMR